LKAYLDSSFLFSLYAPDDHSTAAASELSRIRGALVLSSLSELELVNALELRVFRKELTRKQVDRAHAAFDDDIHRGVLTVFELEPAAFLRAKKLIMQTTSLLGCRAADILHVGAALEVRADRLLSFDQRQKALARHAKLRTN
jgi:predicted nucleic acid-binding protein